MVQGIKERYEKKVVPEMKKIFGYRNDLAVPKIKKVIVNTGFGSKKDEKEKIENIKKSLMLITGQWPAVNPAKKSISTFKLRKGMPIGFSATLRRKRMDDFLEKLINVALPRTRDFRGINTGAIDKSGNLTIGIKEHIVFPETSNEDIRNVFGLGITIVTTAKTKEEATELFRLLGFPFSQK
ncbi:MAG: 50S ribosomal protein L5 [Patescibacteria group bacterium]